jgi:hypothetical protein
LEEVYRFFISYSRQDLDKANLVDEILTSQRFYNLWDQTLDPGLGFTKQIQNRIAHAHVFIPIISESASRRGWVHQEIGYALALKVPVIPLTVGKVPGQMLQLVQAITWSNDIPKLKERLSKEIFTKAIEDNQRTSHPLFECAELHNDRTQMMVDYAKQVLDLKASGRVRQKGGLSSFHIPDRYERSQIWKDRYGPHYGEAHCRLQRLERIELENHFNKNGCSLIINPSLTFDEYGPMSRPVRLKEIYDFLKSKDDQQVKVAISRPTEHHLTIVGDWFAAEAVSAAMVRGIRQTIFTRHAPSVRRSIRIFDEELENLLEEAGIKPEASRVAAVAQIEEILREVVRGLLENPGPVIEKSGEESLTRLEQILADLTAKTLSC